MGIFVGMKTESLIKIPEVLPLIAEPDEFKETWRAFGT